MNPIRFTCPHCGLSGKVEADRENSICCLCGKVFTVEEGLAEAMRRKRPKMLKRRTTVVKHARQ